MDAEDPSAPPPEPARSATVRLDWPVRAEGRTVSSLTMRRPKVRDERDAKRVAEDEGDQEIALLANLCEVAPSTIHELDMVDYRKLQEAFVGFMGADGPTPPPSAPPSPR